MNRRSLALAIIVALLLAKSSRPASARVAPQRNVSPAKMPELLQMIPASAVGVVLLHADLIPQRQKFMDQSPEMARELRSFLVDRVGADLTRVRGLAGFATSLGRKPQGAVVVFLAEPAKLKGKRAGRHRGVKLIRVEGEGLVAAGLPLGLTLGHRAAVKAAIDLSRRKARPQGKRSALGELLAGQVKGARLLTGANAAKIKDPQIQQAVQQFGINLLSLALDKDNKVTAQAVGDPQRLALALAMILQMATMAQKKLEQGKEQAMAGDDTAKAVGAIIATHQFKRFAAEAQPQMQGDRLVSSYQFPDLEGTTMLLPITGILAAVAIPAFIKYKRKAEALRYMSQPEAPPKPLKKKRGRRRKR